MEYNPEAEGEVKIDPEAEKKVKYLTIKNLSGRTSLDKFFKMIKK